MRRHTLSMRFVAALVAPALLVCMTVHAADAALISTERVLAAAGGAGDTRDRLRSLLEREEVRRQLEAWGVSPAEARARIDAMTDAELAGIAPKLDALPAGANGVVGPIVGAILLVFFVLLITDLLGLTDVFPFVKKRR